MLSYIKDREIAYIEAMEDIVILGSGPAGCTAGIYAARAGYSPVLLAGPLPGGLLTQTSKIENYPGYPEAVSGFDLTDAMMRQAEALGTRVEFHSAKKLELQGEIKRIILDDGSVLESRVVILALGAHHKPLEIQGRGRLQGPGISYCATCDGAFYRGEEVVLAGNGSAALNEALFLSTLARCVKLVVPGEALKGPQVLRQRLESAANVEIHLGSRVVDAVQAEDGKLKHVLVQDLVSGERKELPCRGLFLALGFDPDTGLLEGTGIDLDDDGYIKLEDRDRTLTGIPGVFAAGDCTDPRYKQAVIAAGTGAKAGMDAAEFLRNHS